MKKLQFLPALVVLLSANSFAQTESVEADSANKTQPVQEKEIQDMSDPLAVYTNAGAGATNRGLNFKFGQSYKTDDPNVVGMRVLEIQGAMGEDLGWDEASSIDNSIDSFRLRDVNVNKKNGRGTQLDISYNLDGNHLAEQTGKASYSIIQALPKIGRVTLYPLAGVGMDFGNNTFAEGSTPANPEIDVNGFSAYGAFAMVGMYSRITVTDKIWMNYNPFYFKGLTGSDNYMNNAYGPNSDTILTHEVSIGYKITPRLNVRYFANWNENNSFSEGDHRIEFNYQL
ncbi:hypothetical protein [Thalassotalea sp. PLHSN55]|uniref:hypothetical protein n=1 Tax=Thalassotalea sp. PLHSN55 TaxID=3435888 RepID=UPI003F8512D8